MTHFLKVHLNKSQDEYLKQHLLIQKKEMFDYIVYTSKNENIIIEVSEDTADEIRDWAGERLQEVGFDANYNLTDEGVILEQLVDLLLV